MTTYAHDISPDVLAGGEWGMRAEANRLQTPYYVEDSEDVLTGGSWVNTKGVQRWVPQPAPAPPAPAVLTVVPEPLDLSQLVACPQCSAAVTEFCKTTSGAERYAHPDRLVARRCACGMDVPKHRRFCRFCRAEQRAEAREAS